VGGRGWPWVVGGGACIAVRGRVVDRARGVVWVGGWCRPRVTVTVTVSDGQRCDLARCDGRPRPAGDGASLVVDHG